MAEGRRKFTKEFKVEAVRLVKEEGRTLSQVARDLGVNVGVLGKWRRELEEHSTDAFPGKGRLMPQEEELRRLKRENEDLKEDRVHHRDYTTRSEVRRDLFDYIEVFYNRQRRHSYLGYCTPAEFEVMGLVA